MTVKSQVRSMAAAFAVACLAPAWAWGNPVLKIAEICIDGSATADGDLVVKIIARDDPCSATAIFGATQPYDDDDPSPTGVPTTDGEVRDALEAALTPTAGYTVDPSDPTVNDKCIVITGKEHFDVCVDGTRVLGFSGVVPYVENGLTVAGPPSDKTKIPTVSEWGLGIMALLTVTAATVVLMRRRAVAA